MPILPSIGRKSIKLRIVIGLMYTLLTLGSITMLYPFLLMVSGSIKGMADMDQIDVVPKVLYSEKMQFSRFLEDRYSPINTLSAACSNEVFKSSDVDIPRFDQRELDTYHQFIKHEAGRFPDHFYIIQEISMDQKIVRRNYRLFRDQLQKEFVTIDNYNKRFDSAMSSWNEFPSVSDKPLVKEFSYERTAYMNRYMEFKRSRPANEKILLNIDGFYFNSQKLMPLVKSGQIKPIPILTAKCPNGKEAEVWAEFVKHYLNCLFIELNPEGLKEFRKFIAAKYPRGIAQMNNITDTAYPSFDAIKANDEDLRNNAFFTLYTEFITNICPAKYLIVDSPSTRYRQFTGSKSAALPLLANDYTVFKETKMTYLKEIYTRNYVRVIQYIAVYGKAIFNTFVYVGLSILAALTINPLAAYALSRFNLKSTYMILMFFLATMAFPGAVTMIPNFLLLKQLGLLNSYWALVLPVAANGYSIFILKGFFDSIPKEVYESALIDGAGEWTMFWRFTMALSKPILALITLGAFTAAYTAFMFALIICPDERMWTLMVWLYQLQQGAHQSVIYAALVLAAIPTLLVFVFAQNTIMKGIVIPVEK